MTFPIMALKPWKLLAMRPIWHIFAGDMIVINLGPIYDMLTGIYLPMKDCMIMCSAIVQNGLTSKTLHSHADDGEMGKMFQGVMSAQTITPWYSLAFWQLSHLSPLMCVLSTRSWASREHRAL